MKVKNMHIERRSIVVEELNENEIQTRAEKNEDGKRKIILYGALFNTQSRYITEKINGETVSFYERILPEAFNDADMQEVIYTIDHSPDKLLARKSAGNFEVQITERGLMGVATIPDETNSTTIQNDTVKNINQGNYKENSFAFRVAKDGDKWERKEGILYRTISRISKVVDLSTVIMGAYANSMLFVRSLDESQIVEVNEPEFNPELQSDQDYIDLMKVKI